MITITNSMPIKYLDTLEYVKKSKQIKDPGDLAEYQVRQIETAIETAVQYVKNDRQNLAVKDDLRNFATKDDLKNFATKDDLKNFPTKDDLKNFATKDDLKNFPTKDDLKRFATKDDLKDLRYDTLKFVVWTWSSAVALLGGMLARGFHWF